MKLSVVILQTNMSALVTKCLAALSRARLPADTEFIVLNNGRNGENENVDKASYATLKNIRFVQLPPGGYIEGNNRGYAVSSGEYIATFNPDITVHEDTMEKLLDYMERNPDVGVAAPRLIYPDGHEQDSARPFPPILKIIWRRLFQPSVHRASTIQFTSEAENVDWVTGAMFVMSRKCYEATGGHDPRYFLFMSDIALCRDTWKHGMRVVQLRDAKAIHNDVRLSSGGLLHMLKKRTGRWHIKDACMYFMQYGGRRAPMGSPSSRKPFPSR